MTAEMDLTRQAELFPTVERLKKHLVVGCGTTGTWVAFSLLSMGCERVVVMDDDFVEGHNLVAQLHLPLPREDGEVVQVRKVDSFRRLMKRLGRPEAATIAGRATGNNLPECDVVWLCIDNVEGRKQVGAAVLEKGKELIDLRMGVETGTVIYYSAAETSGEIDVRPLKEEYLRSLEGEFKEEGCGPRALLPNALTLVGWAMMHWLATKRGAVEMGRRWRIEGAAGVIMQEEME